MTLIRDTHPLVLIGAAIMLALVTVYILAPNPIEATSTIALHIPDKTMTAR